MFLTSDQNRLPAGTDLTRTGAALWGVVELWSGADVLILQFAATRRGVPPWNGGTPQTIPQACGATWLSTFSTVNKYYSASKQLPFLQLATWDDYEEGSALEPGIDSCAAVGATISTGKRQLNISLTHAENIDHLELYSRSSTGTWNLTNSVAATMANIPITGASETYYLKAVGKPFMKNVLSSRIVVKETTGGGVAASVGDGSGANWVARAKNRVFAVTSLC